VPRRMRWSNICDISQLYRPRARKFVRLMQERRVRNFESQVYNVMAASSGFRERARSQNSMARAILKAHGRHHRTRSTKPSSNTRPATTA
jgi:hypothetical protein